MLTKLSKAAQIIKDGYLPSADDELPYIGLEHIEQQTLKLCGVGKASDVTSGKFQFRAGDILFGKLRPYFRKVYRPKFSGICSTDIWVVRAKPGFDQGFLFYFLANEAFIDLTSQGSSGTRMPRADWNMLKDVEFNFPDLNSQKEIASILSALDDKIELNRQMNQTLEQMAQTLFRQYFVEPLTLANQPESALRPSEHEKQPLGSRAEVKAFTPANREENGITLQETKNLPSGWKSGKIGEIYKTTSGGTPSRTKLEYYGEGFPWIKSKELNGDFILETEESITPFGFKNSSAKLLPVHSVLVAMYGATVGQIAITGIEATCNQAICAILPNKNYPYTFIHQFLKLSKEELINRATGSAQQNISQASIQDFDIVIPPSELVQDYHKVCKDLYSKIEGNLKEVKLLSQTRDTLLPKLMSGEINVLQAAKTGAYEPEQVLS